LHVAVGLGEQLLGQFAFCDIGQHTFPNHGSVGHVARCRFGGDPAGLAVDDHPALFLEGQLVFENIGVLAHPFRVVVGVHAGEGVHRVGARLLAFESGQLEKTRRHEREVGHAAVRRLHHGVGADGDILREFERGAFELLAQRAQGLLGFFSLRHIGHADEQVVVEDDRAENDVALGAVFAGHRELHRFDTALGFDGAEDGFVPFVEHLPAVSGIGISFFRPDGDGWNLLEHVAESARELLVDERHFGG